MDKNFTHQTARSKICKFDFFLPKTSKLVKNKKVIKFIFLIMYCYNAPIYENNKKNCTEKLSYKQLCTIVSKKSEILKQ